MVKVRQPRRAAAAWTSTCAAATSGAAAAARHAPERVGERSRVAAGSPALGPRQRRPLPHPRPPQPRHRARHPLAHRGSLRGHLHARHERRGRGPRPDPPAQRRRAGRTFLPRAAGPHLARRRALGQESVSAAPETLSASRRLVALGAVALAAFGIALGARESGALAPLEREALKARFDVRGAEPVKGMLVVGIDAKTFGELQKTWPFPRSLHGKVVRQLHADGRARDRLRRPVHRAARVRARTSPSSTPSATPAAPCSPRARATTTAARTSWAATTTCAASARAPPPPTSATTRAARSPASRARPASSTASRWSRRSGCKGTRRRAGRLPRRQGLDRLPRPARDDPDGLVRRT